MHLRLKGKFDRVITLHLQWRQARTDPFDYIGLVDLFELILDQNDVNGLLGQLLRIVAILRGKVEGPRLEAQLVLRGHLEPLLGAVRRLVLTCIIL